MRLRQDGRPVWRIGTLAAPRIEWIAAAGPDGPVAERTPEIDRDRLPYRRPYLRPGVLLFLETGHPLAVERLQQGERKQLRMKFAYAGRSGIEARRDQRYARSRAAPVLVTSRPRIAPLDTAGGCGVRLPAWPWSWFNEAGEPPRDGLKARPDATLAAALESWLTDQPILPA